MCLNRESVLLKRMPTDAQTIAAITYYDIIKDYSACREANKYDKDHSAKR